MAGVALLGKQTCVTYQSFVLRRVNDQRAMINCLARVLLAQDRFIIDQTLHDASAVTGGFAARIPRSNFLPIFCGGCIWFLSALPVGGCGVDRRGTHSLEASSSSSSCSAVIGLVQDVSSCAIVIIVTTTALHEIVLHSLGEARAAVRGQIGHCLRARLQLV